MTKKPLGVGIAGLNIGVSWASRSHLPALRQLSEQFTVVGVANRSAESAKAAAAEAGIPNSFEFVDALIHSPEVDIVTVTVRVPGHREIVEAALRAGKHVYCEWPLGIDLDEARMLAELARETGLCAVIGTQAAVTPEIEHVRTLIEEGRIGRVQSVSVLGSGMVWGNEVEPRSTYLIDEKNGATMLSIPVGHMLAAVQRILGPIASVSGATSIACDRVRVKGTGEELPQTVADQVSLIGYLQSGVQLSVHYRGGTPLGHGLYWEIHGSEGDIVIEAVNGHPQMMPLTVSMGRHGEQGLVEISPPAALLEGLPSDPMARNVAVMYARMAQVIGGGQAHLPQFDDAQDLHRLIAAIDRQARAADGLIWTSEWPGRNGKQGSRVFLRPILVLPCSKEILFRQVSPDHPGDRASRSPHLGAPFHRNAAHTCRMQPRLWFRTPQTYPIPRLLPGRGAGVLESHGGLR